MVAQQFECCARFLDLYSYPLYLNSTLEVQEAPELRSLYRHRFSEKEKRDKDGVWRVLCTRFFNQYVPEAGTVVDIGAGYCEFINHISAKRRIAIDANPEVAGFATEGVEIINAPADKIDFLPPGTVDVCFTSNFLEHLPTKAAITQLTLKVYRVLKPSGRFIIMGPNIRYLGGRYWDYYDHHLALTDKSVEELLTIVGFRIDRSLPRFMPYTVKSVFPAWPWLVRLYISLGKVAFPVFGTQFLVIGRKDSSKPQIGAQGSI